MNRVAGLIGMAAKSGQMLSGTAAVEAGIAQNKLKLVICATDLSAKTIKNFHYLCQKYNVSCITFGSIAELGRWIGRPGRGIIGICSDQLAKALYEAIRDAINEKNEVNRHK